MTSEKKVANSFTEDGRGITMGVPHPPSVKLFATFFSEVVEAKRVEFFYLFFD